jgi:membrane-associated phospholipid phosphatase
MLGDDSAVPISTERTQWKTVVSVATTVGILSILSVLAFNIAAPQRGVGVFTLLSARTGPVLSIAGLITQLGDPWFLLFVAIGVYLAGANRSFLPSPRDGAFVVAATFGAFSLTDLLKTLFIAPRPPEAGTATIPAWLPDVLGGTFRSITTGTGYAFPSGHALGTTVVVAALAYKLDVGSRALRWSIASVVVFLVAASRVVLGVHFLVDIVAGTFAGLCFFVIAAAIENREPTRVFVLGVGIGVLVVLMSAASPLAEAWNAGQWLGGSLGAGIAWYVVRPSTALTLREAVAAGLPAGALWIAIYLSSPPLSITVFLTALVSGFAVAAPALIDRVWVT